MSNPKEMTLSRTFRKAFYAGTPLVAITTPDSAHTIRMMINELNEDVMHAEWDVVRGFITHDEKSASALKVVSGNVPVTNAGEMFKAIAKLPPSFVVFVHNAHLLWQNVMIMQSISNLRDLFKPDHKMFVAIGANYTLPKELVNDVLMLDEGLPTDEELDVIIRDVYVNADQTIPSDYSIAQSVDGIRGLSAFLAEQNASMAIGKDGINNAMLWSLKKKSIESNKGIKFFYGGTTFDEIGGLGAIKGLAKGAFHGNVKRGAVVWIDEIDKALAGAGGGNATESSGTSADALDVLLDFMESSGATGIIAVGPPGTGKTITARAMAATYELPLIKLDLNATKGKFVGDSEASIRQAIATIDTLAKGGAFFFATANRLEALPTELLRRFKLGIYFFDTPDVDERETIWQIQFKRYGIDPNSERPDDTTYVGSDIRNICEISHEFGISLIEASKMITPVVQTNPDAVERLRMQADGHFLSASIPGIYNMETAPSHTQRGRTIRVQD